MAYEKTSEKRVSQVTGAETKRESKEDNLKCNRYEESRSEGFKIFVNEKKINWQCRWSIMMIN